jgi:hypothetical protein
MARVFRWMAKRRTDGWLRGEEMDGYWLRGEQMDG